MKGHVFCYKILLNLLLQESRVEGVKPILHYALGLRFGKVCQQNAHKTCAKRGQNARKTHSVI